MSGTSNGPGRTKTDTMIPLHSGMRTIYIKRSTEDMDIDLSKYKFDLSINEGGLLELARRLGCDV